MRNNNADMQTVIDSVAPEGEERDKDKKWISTSYQILLLDLKNTVPFLVFGFLQNILVYFK